VSEQQPGLFPVYSFDTSAFINGRRDLFRPPTFEAIWVAIEKKIEQGEIRAVDEVKIEVGRKDDDAARWVKGRRGLFVPLDHAVQRATREVLAECPRLLAQHGANRNSADPFVIGLAIARNGVVVTQETPANSSKKPRIPDACNALGVRCISLPDYVDEQGWTVQLTA